MSVRTRSLRTRFVLLTTGVTAFALMLVLVSLPRLLDAYITGQESQDLRARDNAASALVDFRLLAVARAGYPIVAPASPPQLSNEARATLAIPDEAGESSYLAAIADVVALADVTVEVYAQPQATGRPLAVLQAKAADPHAAQMTRTQTSASNTFAIVDTYWSQFPGRAPARAVVVTLSSPYTLHDETLLAVVTALVVVAGLALMLAVVVAFIVADRMTTPIRKLTRATRSLAEGDLSARVALSSSGTPEIAELATTFNRMAEQIEQSIAFTRRERDRSREFLADVSHQLRTPIAALRLSNELLRGGAAENPETRSEFVEASQVQVERLNLLAANYLEISRLDSGLVVLDLRSDDLRSAVEGAIEQAEPAAARKHVRLSAKLPPEPLRQPHDPQRLGQVLTNLVGNAVEFTPTDGDVSVTLTETRDGVRITVRDTGVGIAADELSHVFDRFYRGSTASESHGSGSGLGLTIARAIIELHGGRISIASRVGRGTEVDVVLPRNRRPAGSVA